MSGPRKPSVLFFTAAGHNPSKAMTQPRREFTRDVLDADAVSGVTNVDVGDHPETALTYGVKSVPCMVVVTYSNVFLYRSGVLTRRQMHQLLHAAYQL